MSRYQPDKLSGEFSLIEQFFKKTATRADVVLGIGDDAALITMSPGELLVVAMDTLVEGVHFPVHTKAFDIGYKALAVNLSDFAAMGATPAWFTLGLTMPQAENEWLQAFSDGLFVLANRYNMQLIGGDTTRGPLSITIQVHGFVPPHQALLRSSAKVGDKIYVSGTLGDAGLGLLAVTGQCQLDNTSKPWVLQRLNRPEPRIELGVLLRGIASSAIDISDGLLADLQHILTASEVGATVDAKLLPFSAPLKSALSLNAATKMALTAGDDYELCFTIPPENESTLIARLKRLKVPCTCVGEIIDEAGLQLSGTSEALPSLGYQHFT